MSTRKIKSWQEAGLIDEDTAQAIIAYEDTNSQPLAVWATFGIGALAIGLGLISLVAANWEDVPGTVRLAIHLFLLLLMGGWIAFGANRLSDQKSFITEIVLFVFAVLGLTFFGHIGQVYQTGSPLWQPLAIWLILFAPLLLMRGISWLVALLLFVGFAGLCWHYSINLDAFSSIDDKSRSDHLIAFVTTLPALIAAPAAFMRGKSERPMFWKRLEQLALIYAVGGASVLLVISGLGAEMSKSVTPYLIVSAMALAAAAGIVLGRRSRSGEMSAAIMAGAGLIAAASAFLADADTSAGIAFMLFWAGIGAAALYAGWRGVFQFAVAAVALRLIILSFELASDLLTSGFGLIVAGLLILGVAWIAFKVSREFAPQQEGAA